jgi:hypothetical protein
MPKQAVIVSLFLAALLGACSSEDKPLTAAELCEIYLVSDANNVSPNDIEQAICRAGATKTLAQLDAGQRARDCRPGTSASQWVVELLDAVKRKSVAIDWQQANSCLDTSRALRSKTPTHALVGAKKWQDLMKGACKSFYKGTVARNLPCKHDWDCKEGLLCYTDQRYAERTLRCLPTADLGEYCDNTYHPCLASLQCVDSQCAAKLENGQTCSDDAECGSGLCGAATSVCEPAPQASKHLGESCTVTTECEGGCVACRPASANGALTCQVRAGDGEFCRDSADCVLDLACTNHACGVVLASQPCSRQSAMETCTAGLTCIDDGACAAYTASSACAANTKCQWGQASPLSSAACLEVTGECRALPAGGEACLSRQCAASAYCERNKNQCISYAQAGEACASDGVAGPLCAGCDASKCADLWCVRGVCQYRCEFAEDCPAEQYCGKDAEGVPACLPRITENCREGAACAAGSYCYVAAKQCVAIKNRSNCVLDTRCTYDSGKGTCGAAQGALGSCRPQLKTGDHCEQSQEDAQCESAACSEDPDGGYRCEIPSDLIGGCGSNYNGGFLKFAFALGAVLALGRRCRRRSSTLPPS